MPRRSLGSPALTTSAPALRLLEALGHGRSEVTFTQAVARSRKPTSSVARHLAELVEARLVLRLRRDSYATPGKPTHALLLVEPSEYARTVLLAADALERLGAPWAFACLPVRDALDFEIPVAVPVVDLASLGPGRPPLPHDAAALGWSEVQVGAHEARFPTDAQDDPHAALRRFPVLDATTSLALFASAADPRLVRAVARATVPLGIAPEAVVEKATWFMVEDALPRKPRPNTLVLPKWLSAFARTARGLHARRFVDAAARAAARGAG